MTARVFAQTPHAGGHRGVHAAGDVNGCLDKDAGRRRGCLANVEHADPAVGQLDEGAGARRGDDLAHTSGVRPKDVHALVAAKVCAALGSRCEHTDSTVAAHEVHQVVMCKGEGHDTLRNAGGDDLCDERVRTDDEDGAVG